MIKNTIIDIITMFIRMQFRKSHLKTVFGSSMFNNILQLCGNVCTLYFYHKIPNQHNYVPNKVLPLNLAIKRN